MSNVSAKLQSALTDRMIVVSESDYLSLKLGEDKTAETAIVATGDPEKPLRAPQHHILRGARGMKSVVAYLSYYAKVTGSANTPFQFQFYLQPNLDTSWASWQGTFDEFKVLNAELHWKVWFQTLPTAFAAQSPNAAVAYDPTSSAPVSYVNQVMEYEKFQLLSTAANSNGTYAVAPQATSKGGHMVFRAKVPQGGAQSSIVRTGNSAGQWRPTQDASNYEWGMFTGYCAAGGTTSVQQVEGFVRMAVEFRVRR